MWRSMMAQLELFRFGQKDSKLNVLFVVIIKIGG